MFSVQAQHPVATFLSAEEDLHASDEGFPYHLPAMLSSEYKNHLADNLKILCKPG